MKAIKNGNFITFPGLNNQKLLKHLSTSIVTYLRHLDQEHKNLQLTKKVKSELDIEEDKYLYPETDIESFQLQMRISFPFLRDKGLCTSLLIMRTCSFLISCT